MAKAKSGLRVKRAPKAASAATPKTVRRPALAIATVAGMATTPTACRADGAAAPATSAARPQVSVQALFAAARARWTAIGRSVRLSAARGFALIADARRRGALATAGSMLVVAALVAGIVGWRMAHDGPQARAAVSEVTAPAPEPVVAALPTPAPATAKAVAAAKPLVLDGYVLLDVYRGRALLEGGGDLHEVKPGTRLRGAGIIEEIRRQDGRWVVVASKGLITAR